MAIYLGDYFTLANKELSHSLYIFFSVALYCDQYLNLQLKYILHPQEAPSALEKEDVFIMTGTRRQKEVLREEPGEREDHSHLVRFGMEAGP